MGTNSPRGSRFPTMIKIIGLEARRGKIHIHNLPYIRCPESKQEARSFKTCEFIQNTKLNTQDTVLS